MSWTTELPSLILPSPLPDVVGLVHSPLSQDEEDYMSQYWNLYPIRMYFDTTWNIFEDMTASFILPLPWIWQDSQLVSFGRLH
jgi:hypothetical protein